MAMLRRFFYRKPPDGLVEIAERIYVFDHCFTTASLNDKEYKVYMGGILSHVRDHFLEASFMLFNFRDGEQQSHIADILSLYDITLMEYPRHFEGCPLLTLEMIHHFLRSSENWLSLGADNMLLMHCERGGWPVLAFMLSGLLVYRKLYSAEKKTLEMIYRQAPHEILHLLSPLNPLPSQLRYLQYISRRNIGSEWPPHDRALTLDCIILRMIPDFDGKGGCRPLFRIYGQDPIMISDRNPKVLFSMPKKSRSLRLYNQADCDIVKVDVNCYIQGDVVLECVNVDGDLEYEEMMFRVMFNTAFIRSNILMLNRDQIDILWDSKDQFQKAFGIEVLFSEIDAVALLGTETMIINEKEGLPVEAFTKAREIFNSIDWMDSKGDVALHVVNQIAASNHDAMPAKKVGPEALEASTSSPSRELRSDKTSHPTEDLLVTPMTKAPSPSPGESQPSSLVVPPSLPPPLTPPLFAPVPHHPPPPLLPPTLPIQSSLLVLSTPAQQLPGSESVNSMPFSHASDDGISVSTKSGISSLIVPVDLDSSADVGTMTPQKSRSTLNITSSTPPPPPPLPSSLSSHNQITTVNQLSTLLHPLPFSSPHPPPVNNAVTSQPLPPLPQLPPDSLSSLHCTPPVNKAANVPLPPLSPPPPLSSTPLSSHHYTLVNKSANVPPPPPPPQSLSYNASSIVAASFKNLQSRPPPPPPPKFSNISTSSKCSAITGIRPSAASLPEDCVDGLDSSSQCSIVSKNTGSVVIPQPPTGLNAAFSSMSVKGRVLRRASTSPLNIISTQSSKKTLKALHWVKVTRAMKGSLWAESQKSDDISKAPEIDMSELENLFSVVPNAGEKSGRRSSIEPKSEIIHLIDLRRANNCEIMLTQVKMPMSDLMNMVLALDDSIIDVDQVDNLIKFCPTKEEMELLKGHNGDKENLGKCEQFFLELMKVPRVESKLRVFSFKIQFSSQICDLRSSLNIINSAAEEVRNSVKLKRVMQTILSLGNALNQGTARGSAIGFRLDSLLKLTDTRARNNKMTLTHYLCKVLAEKLPEVLDFDTDLVSLEAAAKIQLKTLAEEMQAISKGLEKLEEELTLSEDDGPVSQTFQKTLKEFLVIAEAKVRDLTCLYSGVGRSADALALYFGEDPVRCSFEQVLSTLLSFVKTFGRAHIENCRQLELEKKRAQRESEVDKIKPGTPKKTADRPLMQAMEPNRRK